MQLLPESSPPCITHLNVVPSDMGSSGLQIKTSSVLILQWVSCPSIISMVYKRLKNEDNMEKLTEMETKSFHFLTACIEAKIREKVSTPYNLYILTVNSVCMSKTLSGPVSFSINDIIHPPPLKYYSFCLLSAFHCLFYFRVAQIVWNVSGAHFLFE